MCKASLHAIHQQAPSYSFFCFFKRYVQRPMLLRGKKQESKATGKAQDFPGASLMGSSQGGRYVGLGETRQS